MSSFYRVVWAILLLAGTPTANAQVEVLQIPMGPGDILTTHVDNNGGYGIPFDDPNPDLGRFKMIFNSVEQGNEGSLIISDGSGTTDGIYNGREDNDFSVANTNLELFGPGLVFGTSDRVVSAVGVPHQSTTFISHDGRIKVFQDAALKLDQQFIVYRWLIENTSGQTLDPVKVMLLVDWDLYNLNDDQQNDFVTIADELTGWLPGQNLVYQQDSPNNLDQRYHTAGLALLAGTLDNYHLGNYDEFAASNFRESDNLLLDYFSGINVGDQEDGTPDKHVAISANLGQMQNGETKCVAFVQAIARDEIAPFSAAEGLANLQAQITAAQQMYASWDDTQKCAPNPPIINAGMNTAWVNANAPFQGHFLTVYPDAGLIFQSWFTFDSMVQARAKMQSEGSRAKLEQAATFGADDQRWVTALGVIDGNKATLSVENTSGGIFNGSDPTATQTPDYGTITLEFLTCGEAIMTYDFPSVGLSGTDTLVRAVDDSELCEILATP